MSSQERAPASNPLRIPVGETLGQMPSAQQLYSSHETVVFRYSHSRDRLDPPVVIQYDMPYVRSDSDIFRKPQDSPLEQILASGDGTYMSASQMRAFVRAAELEALAEIQAGTADPQTQQRKLLFQYDGPDGHIELDVREPADGTKINRVLSALSNEPTRIQPDYEQASYQVPISTSYMPSQQYSELEGAFGSPRLNADESGGDIQLPEGVPHEPGFISKHRRAATMALIACTSFWWFRPVGNVAYEAAKQGINGDRISVSDIKKAATGKEVTTKGDE